MQRRSKKAAIINAASQLLVEVGYESMSPAMVLARSGAGKGSLYHFFSGKKQLALAALQNMAEEMKADLQELLDDEQLTAFGKIDQYLARKRDGMAGCRIGRLANEGAFLDDELRAPMQDYFRFVLQQMQVLVGQCVKDGTFAVDTPVEHIASLIVASVQGGYVNSKAVADGEQISMATGALRVLLKTYCVK